VLFYTHPICGESDIQHNNSREVVTIKTYKVKVLIPYKIIIKGLIPYNTVSKFNTCVVIINIKHEIATLI